ncbi:MAG: exodeoxyribonuclease VII small subunit [Clostridia bacterium]|nr:exodeoxyribonuclease VII small subunit [Clostridia bacterium]
MSKAENKPKFEEILAKLEQSSENIKKENITLEDALKNFEEGIAYYEACSEILNNAKQKIETYSKE